jgi:hypothetical protein
MIPSGTDGRVQPGISEAFKTSAHQTAISIPKGKLPALFNRSKNKMRKSY